MNLYPCAAGYTDERMCGSAAQTRPRAASVRARVSACARAIGRARFRADTCERVPSAWTAGGLGAQAFLTDSAAFNANIGAWNTARVTTLDRVCAAFPAPGGAPPQAGRARRVVDAAQAVVRGGTADARARMRVCGIWAPTHPRRHVRAPSVGVDHVRFRRAGVLTSVGVQREHRRVEHRACHHVVRGMRRLFGPAARHRGRDALGRVVGAARAVVRGGAADAHARVCVHRRVGARMRGRPRVQV